MIFGAFERMVALRYLRARRKEGFVSVIVGFSFVGIVLGVATLIIVMAVMNGFRADMFDRILGFDGHMKVYGVTEMGIADFDAKAAKVRAVPGVVDVIPIVEGQVLATSSAATSGAIVRGMRWQDLEKKSRVSDHIVGGSLAPFNGGEGLLIGARMSNRFNVPAGEELTLISPKGNVTAFGSVPRSVAFPVGGVFTADENDFDSSFIFMPLELAQTYFKLPDAVTYLEVRVDNPDHASAIAGQVRAALGNSVQVFSWEQTNGAFFTALQVERNVMFLILTLIILVAVLNIISGLTMLVKDKGSDIAILRTMGASKGMVMRVFFMTGATVGLLGTLGGFVLGALFCANIEHIHEFIRTVTGKEVFNPEIYYLTQIPAKMEWSETGAVVIMALVLSFAGTLYPSWKASKVDPVEALRYE